jgi:NAD-dependent dihydropyrimidine dehydrogenase PreA subunit
MRVNEEKCTGCQQCIPFCSVEAIQLKSITVGSKKKKKAWIDEDLCAECGNCKFVSVCPTDALEEIELHWPRSIRAILSNPLVIFKETGVNGRGTEEMKTNDVTGRFGPNDIGISVDVGRPGGGTRLSELEKITKAVAKLGVEFESGNPVTFLMVDKKTGELRADIRNELVVSAVIEFKVTPEKVLDVVKTLKGVAEDVDTVFSVGVINKVSDDGSIPIRSLLESSGISVRPNAKINLGLGRLAP